MGNLPSFRISSLEPKDSEEAVGVFLLTPDGKIRVAQKNLTFALSADTWSSTMAELEGLLTGLLEFSEQIRKFNNTTLVIFNDNLANIKNCQKEGSKRENLKGLYQSFFNLLNNLTEERVFLWKNREELTFQLADSLSKYHIPTIDADFYNFFAVNFKKHTLNKCSPLFTPKKLLSFHRNNIMKLLKYQNTKQTFVFQLHCSSFILRKFY